MLLSISKDVMQALCRFQDIHASLVCFLFKSIVCFISDHSTILNKIIFYLVESFVGVNIVFPLRGLWTRETNLPRSSWFVISLGLGAGKSKAFCNLCVTLRSTFLWSSIRFKVYPFTNLQVSGMVFIIWCQSTLEGSVFVYIFHHPHLSIFYKRKSLTRSQEIIAYKAESRPLFYLS